jgi:glycosyltransferase involved in cell wall biosynthesis
LKISYLSYDEVPSFKGASTHILSFCKALMQEHETTLLTLGAVELPHQRNFAHRKVELKATNPLERGLEFRDICKRFIKSYSADVLHVRSPWEGIAACDAKLPFIYEVNGFPSIEMPYHYPQMTDHARRVLAAWEYRCCAESTHIVTPSRVTKDYIGRLNGDFVAKTKVIPNGYIGCGSRPEGFSVQRCKVTEKKLKFVYIGTLNPWQGLTWSLKYLAELEIPWSLNVYAPHHRSFTKLFLKYVNRYGLDDRVALHQPLQSSEIELALGCYDVGLCPLLPCERNVIQGCCPIKIFDYLKAGLWTLAPSLPVVTELLEEDKNAIFFSPGNGQSLLDALRHFFDQSGQHFVRPDIASSRAITWEQAGEELLEIYAEVFC